MSATKGFLTARYRGQTVLNNLLFCVEAEVTGVIEHAVDAAATHSLERGLLGSLGQRSCNLDRHSKAGVRAYVSLEG